MITTLDGFEHRLLTVDEVKIHTVAGGTGTPVVLLHGFPQTWWEWRQVMPALAARHRVVAVDLRGAGFSDCPQGGYDKATLAEDVHGVMTQLGHNSYAACGHDIGAMVAVALASTHRDAVTKLVVLDAPLPGWSQWEAMYARYWHFGFQQNRDLPELLIAGREYDYISNFIAVRTVDHGTYDPADIEVFARAFAQPGRTRGAMEWYRAFPLDHVNGCAWKSEPLTIPVLALGGEYRFGPEIVAMMTEFATDVRGGSIAGASHYVADERPSATADAILDFLG